MKYQVLSTRKTMKKKYSRLSSAAVVIGALRINSFQMLRRLVSAHLM